MNFPLSKRAVKVIIEPMDPAVQKALSRIEQRFPELLNKVEKIVVHPGHSSHLGEVRSGPGENPRFIHLFKGRIESDARQHAVKHGKPADANMLAHVVERAIVSVIGHEAGHIKPEDAPHSPFHDEPTAERKSEETLKRVYPEGLPLAAMRLDHIRRKLVPHEKYIEPDLAFVVKVALGDNRKIIHHALQLFKRGSTSAVIELDNADSFNKDCMRSFRISPLLGYVSHLIGCNPNEQNFSEKLAMWQGLNDINVSGKLDDITAATVRARMPSFDSFPRNFGIVQMDPLFCRGGQPDNSEQLKEMRDKLGVERVVSLNKDLPELSNWCSDLGMEHVQASLGGGHPYDEGWQVLKPSVSGFIMEKPTFIHCRHGMDRTGGVVATYRTERGWMCDLAYREAKSYGFRDRFTDLVERFTSNCQHETAHSHPPVDIDVIKKVIEEMLAITDDQHIQDALDATPSDIHYRDLGSSMDNFSYESGATTILNPYSRQVPHSLPGGGGR
jgi:hypothetical protein